MNLVRWEPFEAMNLFNPFPGFFGRPMPGGEYQDWLPTADISETDDEYLIRAALPAVKKEDVKVTYKDGMLTLSGQRRRHDQEKGEKFRRVETYYGNFERTFALPDVIDAEAIKADYKDGVLTIHLRKLEPKKITRITVQ